MFTFKELLVLLALLMGGGDDRVPCWEVEGLELPWPLLLLPLPPENFINVN